MSGPLGRLFVANNTRDSISHNHLVSRFTLRIEVVLLGETDAASFPSFARGLVRACRGPDWSLTWGPAWSPRIRGDRDSSGGDLPNSQDSLEQWSSRWPDPGRPQSEGPTSMVPGRGHQPRHCRTLSTKRDVPVVRAEETEYWMPLRGLVASLAFPLVENAQARTQIMRSQG